MALPDCAGPRDARVRCDRWACGRKKLKMAYQRSVLDSSAANHTACLLGGKKLAGYRQAQMLISEDSGYNESLKTLSPGFQEASRDSSESDTPTQECENSENIDPTVLCSPVRDDTSWECTTGCKDKPHSELYETPRAGKKDFSLRRRLLLSKATTDGFLDFEVSECSGESSQSKKLLQHIPCFEASLCNGFIESPRDAIYKPLATSTLKADSDADTSCKKWRLSFAQQRSSTINDCKCGTDPFPGVENLSPVQCTESPGNTIHSSSEENTPEVPATPICNLITHAKEDFQTPVSDLAARLRFSLCTPTGAQVSDLESSGTEDSAFHSLSFDKSQDSLTDHEGSFQELLQKHKETPRSGSQSRLRKLERCRRLSTLRERGSQSEGEEDHTEGRILSSSYKSKVARDSVDEENEFSFESCQTSSILNIKDLTGTPALRMVRDMVTRSSQKRAQPATVRDLLGSFDHSEDTLTMLIGRKMGLEHVDILSELKNRNLKHILASIFSILDAESICSLAYLNCNKDQQHLLVVNPAFVPQLSFPLYASGKLKPGGARTICSMEEANPRTAAAPILGLQRSPEKLDVGHPAPYAVPLSRHESLPVSLRCGNSPAICYSKLPRHYNEWSGVWQLTQERRLSSEDAATRLQMVNRSALKSVQAQSRFVFHTPTSCGSLTPKISSNPHSGSKQQEYVKVTKTLFTDEALKPCPQCQYPAKYQPLKKRGKCSRKDCGFDFCVLCLCSFHGSKECGSGSGKRVHKNTLPGSAQSKRNLRRL
ncbi:F-box only protein 43 [Gastrophryne carolinensis]